MSSSVQSVAPVRRALTVDAPLETAFDVFTTGVSSWWPLETHSLGAKREDGVRAVSVHIEPRVGGRMYERLSDGTDGDWGEVAVWDPPDRIVIGWRLDPAGPATELDVRFTDEAGRTRVELEHRGWERLGERGPGARESYEEGWPGVLDRFRAVFR
jgi:uncharacterized protein YndB with AHSA1/START domain